VPATRAVLYFDNSGSPTGGHNVGPLNVASMTKLHALRVRGSVLGGFTNVAAGSANDNGVFMGAQWVTHGSSPLSVVTQSTVSNFLWVGQYQTDAVAIWAPTTGDGEFGSWVPINIDWQGQFPLGNDIDFYFSTGQTVGSGRTWAEAGNIEVLYT